MVLQRASNNDNPFCGLLILTWLKLCVGVEIATVCDKPGFKAPDGF